MATTLTGALLKACENGDWPFIENALQAGFNINSAIGPLGETLLIMSVFSNQNKIGDKLLQYGADPNTSMVNNQTPLMIAAALGNYMALRALIGVGAIVNTQTRDGVTALMFALSEKRDACCVYLILKGANPYLQDSNGYNAWNYAQNSCLERHLDDLIAYSADCNKVMKAYITHSQIGHYDSSYDGWPLIVQCAKYGLVVELMRCLKHGVSPNCENPAGASALNFAVKYQHLDCVNTLLEAGAEVNRQSHGGRTPLMMAIKYDATGDVTEALLKHGADPYIKSTYDGWTAFDFLKTIPNYEPYVTIKLRLEKLLTQ